MIIQIDAKQLEWVCAIYLSQDPVGILEILNDFDQHEDNQKRFGLPSRIAAKVLLFRTIYGGSGYSFSIDPEFSNLGGEKFWNEKIEQFYRKYKGLHEWHQRTIEQVIESNGRLELPTGRIYQFDWHNLVNGGYLSEKEKRHIKNYPVQGLAADLMAIARASLYKRLYKSGYLERILIVNTVHDSIILDAKKKDYWELSIEPVVLQVFKDIPDNFKRLFNIEFNLPIRCKITYGKTWKEAKE